MAVAIQSLDAITTKFGVRAYCPIIFRFQKEFTKIIATITVQLLGPLLVGPLLSLLSSAKFLKTRILNKKLIMPEKRYGPPMGLLPTVSQQFMDLRWICVFVGALVVVFFPPLHCAFCFNEHLG